MRRKEHKHDLAAGALQGLLVEVLSLVCLLLLLTSLTKSGNISEPLLLLLLPLSCLLSSTAGVLCVSGNKEDRILSLLLTGVVPSVCLLCCGLLFTGGDAAGSLFWNAGAFLIPAFAAMLPGSKRSRRRR